jgi:N-acetyltransferase 10
MFNKAVRKISIALNSVVEEKEKQSLLGGEKRLVVQKAVQGMRDVAEKTLAEDAADAAKDVMKTFSGDKSLPPEIANDSSLMQYAIKGSDEQWSKVLESGDLNEAGTVSIKSVRPKRKNVDTDDYEREAQHETGKASKKKKKSTKGRRKSS